MRCWAVLATTAAFACSTFDATTTDTPANADGGVDAAAADAPTPTPTDGGLLAESFAMAADVRALAIDDTNVYWLTGAKLFTCPIGGCDGASPKVLAMVINGKALVARSGLVFFLDDNGLSGVPKTGAEAARNLATLASSVLAFAGGSAYYEQQSTIWICRTPTIAGGCSSAESLGGNPPAFLSDGNATDLWWADTGGAVRGCTYDTCAIVRTLAGGESGIQHFVVNDRYAFWSSGSSLRGANLASANVGASAPAGAVSALPLAGEPSDLVVTGTALFLSFGALGTVVKQTFPPAGAGKTVAEGLATPTVMASNGEVLFVACSGDSTLRKVSLSP